MSRSAGRTELALRLQDREGKGQLGGQAAAPRRVVGSGLGIPGVEGQQLGVHQEEGMDHLVPATLRAGIDVLHHLPLQELDALLAKLRVDQPLHSLECRWKGMLLSASRPSHAAPGAGQSFHCYRELPQSPHPRASSHIPGSSQSHTHGVLKVRDTLWHGTSTAKLWSSSRKRL